jgi:S-formylglutathione hydrolase FrmB
VAPIDLDPVPKWCCRARSIYSTKIQPTEKLNMLHAFLRRTVVSALTALTGLAAHAQTPPVLPQPSAYGLQLLDLQPLNSTPRLWNAVVSSGALSEPVHVAIHLPPDYDSQPAKRYPVLFLLHGQGEPLDRSLPWPVSGNAASLIDASPYKGIVVMPQCGKACWYTDWVKATPGGQKPQWETYYIQQLLPWIDANFRTIGTRATRSIAGLSMGGYGALAMSARFPHLFSQVGSFSGAMNIQDLVMQQVVLANTVTLGNGAAYVSGQTGTAWRARDVQDVIGLYSSDNWRSRNPYALADVYGRENIRMALYSGGGAGSFDVIEMGAGTFNDSFHNKLKASGSPHRYCRGSVGTHSWPYWKADLVDFLQVLVGQPPATCPNGWGAPRP